MFSSLKNKDFKKIEKKFNKIAPLFLFSVIILIVAVVVILSSRYARKEIEEYKIRNKTVYTYVAGVRLEYDGKMTLNHSDNVTMMELDNGYVKMGREPLYIEGEKTAIFPVTMSVVFPTLKMAQYKISYFTLVEFNDVQYVLSNIDLNYPIYNAFIYDGNNIYFFVEEAKITFGENTVVIPPMSFVKCEFKGDLEIFDYDKQESVVYPDVFDDVYASTSSFTLNLSVDSVKFSNSSALLIKDVDKLGKLK